MNREGSLIWKAYIVGITCVGGILEKFFRRNSGEIEDPAAEV